MTLVKCMSMYAYVCILVYMCVFVIVLRQESDNDVCGVHKNFFPVTVLFFSFFHFFFFFLISLLLSLGNSEEN